MREEGILLKENTVSLNLRAVPENLVRRVKSAAALEGRTMREWILQAIEERLKRHSQRRESPLSR